MSSQLMDKVIDFVNSTTFDNLPNDIKKISKLAIIDTVGVALAGWKEPSVQILKDVYALRETKSEAAILWGDPKKVPLEYAALINGTATHALDFDDVTPTVLAHPSAPIVSAIIPLAEYLGKSGKEVITAYAIGTEVMIRIGQVMGFSHYDLGWHATSTLGTIGATVACGYLLQLDKEKLTHAIAISASMAGGLQKNFGTMTKPLHVGLAAQHATQSSLLASRGFVANSEIFESRGFFNVFSGNKSQEKFDEKQKEIDFGKPYDYQINGLSVKKFPCCYLTHRFIQGVLELRQEFNLKLDDVNEIVVLVPQGGLLPLIHKRPVTGLQGKFSAEYTCLAALADGKVQLETFTDMNVKREDIQRNFSIIKTREKEGTPNEGQQLDKIPVEISIKGKGGEQYEKVVYHAPGSMERPMSLEEYHEKWMNCFAYMLRDTKVIDKQLEDQISNLFQQAIHMENIEQMKKWIHNINHIIN